MNLTIKLLFILLFIFSLSPVCFSQNLETLKPMEVGKGDFIPKDGIDLSLAISLIKETIPKKKGKKTPEIQLEEITTKEIWNTSKFQIFKSNSYPMDNNIVIIKNGKIVEIMECSLYK